MANSAHSLLRRHGCCSSVKQLASRLGGATTMQIMISLVHWIRSVLNTMHSRIRTRQRRLAHASPPGRAWALRRWDGRLESCTCLGLLRGSCLVSIRVILLSPLCMHRLGDHWPGGQRWGTARSIRGGMPALPPICRRLGGDLGAHRRESMQRGPCTALGTLGKQIS